MNQILHETQNEYLLKSVFFLGVQNAYLFHEHLYKVMVAHFDECLIGLVHFPLEAESLSTSIINLSPVVLPIYGHPILFILSKYSLEVDKLFLIVPQIVQHVRAIKSLPPLHRIFGISIHLQGSIFLWHDAEE